MNQVLLIKFVVIKKGVSEQVDEMGGDGEAKGNIQGHFFEFLLAFGLTFGSLVF